YRKLEDARNKLEATLSDFRLLRRKRNGWMSALIMDMNKEIKGDTKLAVYATSEQLKELLLKTLKERKKRDLGKRRYQDILAMNERLGKLHKRLDTLEKSYNSLWEKESKSLKRKLSQTVDFSKQSAVLTLEEIEIELDHKQKIQLARAIDAVLREMMERKGKRTSRHVAFNMDEYMWLAIQLLNILDDMLNITEPEEMLAIEASREADFGCIDPDITPQTKMGWGHLMVKQWQEDRTRTAHRVAMGLVHYLNLAMGESIIDDLVMKYDASRGFLEQLQAAEGHSLILASEGLKRHLLTQLACG